MPRILFAFVTLVVLVALCAPRIHAEPSPADCASCTAVMEGVIKVIGDNATQATVVEALEKECKKLPKLLILECDKLAKKAASKLPKLEATLERYTAHGLCTILDKCEVKCCETPHTPEQVHLSVTGEPTEMAVTWVTQQSVSQPAVWVSSNGGSSFSSPLLGTSRTYTKGGWVGYIHTAIMTGLTAGGVNYTYYVGDAGDSSHDSSSPVFWFKSALPSPQASFQVGVVADMGTVNSADTIRLLSQRAQSGSMDMMIHAGDISYADALQHIWDEFLRMVEGISAYVPYMVCPGNHEIPWLFTAYRTRFSMPGNSSGSNSNMYYSFDYGIVHFVAINTETIVDEGNVNPDQIHWLEEDLLKANQNRDKTPWIVAYFHRPLYCSDHGFDCGDNAKHLRKQLEGLLHGNKVDLVLTGHQHDYERTYPVYDEKVVSTSYHNPGAPTYIVNGVGGNHEGLRGSYHPGVWSAAHYVEFGYGIITVHNRTALTWDFYVNDGDQLTDSITLTK
mmetsp:Transcript_253/g.750  ORF Transcript_253/g.750 Transcript_253/m.750 type:complete len:505 (+) Transcript_253:57-1571(+)